MKDTAKRRIVKIVSILIFIIALAIVQKMEEQDEVTLEESLETEKTQEMDMQGGETEAVKPEEIIEPSKEDVINMRAQVLEGMSDEDITRMKQIIKSSNIAFEHEIMWNNCLVRLADPRDMLWDLLDDTGEIQIGWAYEGDIKDIRKLKKEVGLSEDEFNEQYGVPVIKYNNYDAEDFNICMEELKESTNSIKLKKDFDQLIYNMKMAKETHEVEYIETLYKILHDMDYFLFRYGPEDVGKYTQDDSVVDKYYGVLNVYSN